MLRCAKITILLLQKVFKVLFTSESMSLSASDKNSSSSALESYGKRSQSILFM